MVLRGEEGELDGKRGGTVAEEVVLARDLEGDEVLVVLNAS